MTVKELIEELSKFPQDSEVVARYVGNDFNSDIDIESARIGIIGGPIKATERMGVILR